MTHRVPFKLLPLSAIVAFMGAISLTQAQAQDTTQAPSPDAASAFTRSNWEAGVVLDASLNSHKLELGARDKSAALGHSDAMVRGTLGEHFSAEGVLAFHTEDDKLETHVENAWIQTRTLPHGFQLRAGRFSSQIGYQNELHPHADDFSERPLLYRAFLGGHWFDDGARLNWTAPTPFFLRLGAEVFSGKKLVPEAAAQSTSRVSTANIKVGDDINANNSWQWGLSHVYNPREAEVEVHDPAAHDHSHAAGFTGKRMWLSDLVYKWSPEGNNRNQQVRLQWEYAQVGQLNRYAQSAQQHRASTVSAVWRFHPAWEAGVRSDWLDVNKFENHEGDIESGRGKLREKAVMLAYKPTHMQTLRLQLAQQKARGANDEGEAVFANPAKRSIMLQYVIGFGAHGAHAY